MDYERLNFISLLVAGVGFVVLFWRAHRLRMFRRYPWVYAYIGITLLVEVVGEVLAARLGVESSSYALWYVWLLLAYAAAGTAVLLRIYYLRRNPSLVDAHLLLFLALILTRPFFWIEGFWLSYRLLTGAQMLQTYLGMCAFARLFFGGRMLPGWNLTMVVVAITIPSIFHSLILAEYLFGGAFSYAGSSLGMELSAIAFWIILVVGLWEYSPPAQLKLTQRLRDDFRARIWANIKTLWGLR